MSEHRVRAKKSLGQNFLTSTKAVADIVQAARISHGDTVLEIGPGKGVLTRALLSAVGEAGRVVAVEKDDRLVPYLQELFAQEVAAGRLILIHGDILEHPLNTLPLPSSYILVANIPYYITGALLRRALSETHQPTRAVLMLQKEVARRIVARDGKESLLSLSVKVYGAPVYVRTVDAILFSPAPKVDSAILLIDNISKNFFSDCSEDTFFSALKAGFAHKRKLLARNLESSFEPTAIARALSVCDLPRTARAEDIPLATWKRLVQEL